jgi:sigma-B regulation protein RsbU (phosphoserine phosphatase)
MDKVRLEEETSSVFEPLRIETNDEIEDLWKSMAVMETDVRESMVRLREITAAKERLDAELAIATEIQMGLLPDQFPHSPEYDLFASMDPAKEVGGDLYDFFMVDDTHLALVIADVSGKGISAALFMVVAKTLIRNQTEHGAQDPAEIFALVNRKLMEVNRARMFVTAWLGILDLKSGRVAYVNAGHEYPAIRRAGREFVLFPDKHCFPLAAFGQAVFRSAEFTLEPGDTLFVYTDGVAEAHNEEGELMGTGRMLRMLNRIPDAGPHDVIENVKSGMAEYVKTAEQFDDTTMLCIRFNGSDSSKPAGS